MMYLALILLAQAPALQAADLPPGSIVVAPHISPPVKATEVPASGAAAPPSPRDLKGGPDQTVCKLIATTGSHIPRSDCRTRAEWNQLAVDSRDATLQLQSGQNGYSNTDLQRSFSGK